MSATAEDIALFESFFINNCCGVVIPALLVYEYLITFDHEVDLFWRPRFTGASVLFLLNRYLPLITIILELCQMLRMSDRVSTGHCNAFVILTGVVSVLQYVPWAAFSALRVFALSGHHWALSVLVLSLSSVPIIINYVRYRWLKSLNDPIFGCRTELTLSLELAQKLLLLMNVLHLTFAMLSVNQAFVKVSYVTIFTEPLTAVLVSRFLFNLQGTRQPQDYTSSIRRTTDQLDTGFTVNGASLATIVGSLGADIGGNWVPVHIGYAEEPLTCGISGLRVAEPETDGIMSA
ncbi:hypothetical protein C8Q78DRAFT_963789 [Trametes maxima]|nr:hypothetical protein C8Q78DRAFT_963789 [Trametes maxima]